VSEPWTVAPPLTEEDLEHLLDVHPLAQVAVQEIRQLRAALLVEGAGLVRHPEERCPDCDCTFATEEQRERPELEYPLLCRRRLEGDVCTNPPMEWRSRALKFESALALAVRYATKYREDQQRLKLELGNVDLALKPLEWLATLKRDERLAVLVQESPRNPRHPSRHTSRRRRRR
jgi:hypothetical protein